MIKSFKNFLYETPYHDEELDGNVDKDIPRRENGGKIKEKNIISVMPSGHKITKEKLFSNIGADRYRYTAFGQDDYPDIHVDGIHDGNKFFVGDLQKYTGSTLKAHDFYHHLITNHDIHLHSDTTQSYGGKAVWKKLYNKPDIEMHVTDKNGSYYDELSHPESFTRSYDNDNYTRLAARKK